MKREHGLPTMVGQGEINKVQMGLMLLTYEVQWLVAVELHRADTETLRGTLEFVA